MHTIWFVILAIESGITFFFKILNVLVLPIARSTCTRRDAIFLPDSTSCGGSCRHPWRNGRMFSSIFKSLSMSFIVKPLSAIIDIPGLSLGAVR